MRSGYYSYFTLLSKNEELELRTLLSKNEELTLKYSVFLTYAQQ